MQQKLELEMEKTKLEEEKNVTVPVA